MDLNVIEKLPGLPLRDVVIVPSEVRALFIGRRQSIAAIEQAMADDLEVFLIAQQSVHDDQPKLDQLHAMGTVARIIQAIKLPDGTRKVLVQGVVRAQISEFYSDQDSYMFSLQRIPVTPITDAENATLSRLLWEKFETFVKHSDAINSEVLGALKIIQTAEALADAITMHLSMLTVEEKQKILEMLDVRQRVERLVVMISREMEWKKIEKNINSKVRQAMEEDQEAYFHEKRLKAIQSELGDKSSLMGSDVDDLAEKLSKTPLPDLAREKVESELSKLQAMAPMSPEASVIRNYLGWVLDMPWGKHTDIQYDLGAAQKTLDADHHGLNKVKDRVLESLAVQRRVKKISGSILCLVGPPGVGKTSLGASIAKAMGREFVRIALGGVRDEAEIRGHRKTYVGAMPGRIVKALKRAGVSNPLILLDEVDKLGMDFRGDPASALLEVLDPEQNNTFNDHYIELDFDLSQVMFITTANSYDIPDALLDRMEVIELSGYTESEKQTITHDYLIPKALEMVGLTSKEIRFSPAGILDIIRFHTREAGVRELERMIQKICRKHVRRLEETDEKPSSKQINKKNLEDYLGVKKYEFETAHKKHEVGLARGMAWTRVGGDLLTIEGLIFPGKGKMVYTGSLGDVMQESIQTAATVVKRLGVGLNLPDSYFEDSDIHIHLPEGATPKDGPSAGITLCCALMSIITNIPVRHDIAMTGEVTLRGQVLAIGGLKEKLLAALRGQIKTVIIPKENKQDLAEMPEEVAKHLTIHCVETIEEVLQLALVKDYTRFRYGPSKPKRKKTKKQSS